MTDSNWLAGLKVGTLVAVTGYQDDIGVIEAENKIYWTLEDGRKFNKNTGLIRGTSGGFPMTRLEPATKEKAAKVQLRLAREHLKHLIKYGSEEAILVADIAARLYSAKETFMTALAQHPKSSRAIAALLPKEVK